ncbi:RVT_3 domain-containing protein [Cephalotus follicularis]|uniref:RVT_3 domain-containing protein n=1 Tax=Cephalotus follicularis TaxID=3775 RepID=A0A1Q3BN24_CEPFO|nr:RVT_3 domain-containing protein [Cephalotus follicularis]
MLAKSDISDRLIKWSVELSEYDITNEARPSIKSQVLADFVGDHTLTVCMEEDTSEVDKGLWKLSVYGSCRVSGSGACLVLTSLYGYTLVYALRFELKSTNNEAEWEALIVGLTIAKHLEVQKIEASSDSQLVVGLANGEYEAREDSMAKYLAHVQCLKLSFQVLRILKVPGAENTRTYQLSKLATAEELQKNQTVPVDYLDRPSISEMDVMDIDVPHEPNWMTPVISWLRDGILSEEARRLVYRANRYQF